MCVAAGRPHCGDLRPGAPTRSAIGRERCPSSPPSLNSLSAVAVSPATRRDASALLFLHQKPFPTARKREERLSDTSARNGVLFTSDRSGKRRQNAILPLLGPPPPPLPQLTFTATAAAPAATFYLLGCSGHVDMVTEKNADSSHDFFTDPIRLMVEGDWLTADGTTLGADNGIGVAAALALLDSKKRTRP